MTTFISSRENQHPRAVPAHRYAAHVETVLERRRSRLPWRVVALAVWAALLGIAWLWFCFYSNAALLLPINK